MANEYEAIPIMMNHMLHEFHASVTMKTYLARHTGTKVANLAPMSPLGVGLCVFQPKAPVQRDFKANLIYKERRSNIGKINYEPGRQGMSYLYREPLKNASQVL